MLLQFKINDPAYTPKHERLPSIPKADVQNHLTPDCAKGKAPRTRIRKQQAEGQGGVPSDSATITQRLFQVPQIGAKEERRVLRYASDGLSVEVR